MLRTGDDGRAGLDPWVAALGAMATIAAVIGPLLPIDGADVDLNWSSPPGTDVPTAWFVARLVQLVLLLLCGVFGFLLVRRYGLGPGDRRHDLCRLARADYCDRADRSVRSAWPVGDTKPAL